MNVRQNQATLVVRKADLDQAQRFKRRIGLDAKGGRFNEEILITPRSPSCQAIRL